MKRWQILVTIVAMLAVGLAGYAVGASRQATELTVESQAASMELAVEEVPGIGLEGDYTDGGWDDSFYQPLKIHIEWNVDDLSDEPWY